MSRGGGRTLYAVMISGCRLRYIRWIVEDRRMPADIYVGLLGRVSLGVCRVWRRGFGCLLLCSASVVYYCCVHACVDGRTFFFVVLGGFVVGHARCTTYCVCPPLVSRALLSHVRRARGMSVFDESAVAGEGGFGKFW